MWAVPAKKLITWTRICLVLMVDELSFLASKLFVASFPLAPLFALINNVLEIRVDASKFINIYQRPPALRAATIGVWENVLAYIAYFSVITNGMVRVGFYYQRVTSFSGSQRN